MNQSSAKISYAEWQGLLQNDQTSDEQIREYSIARAIGRGTELELVPNPDRVSPPLVDEVAATGIIGFGLAWFKWRRQQEFLTRQLKDDQSPVLVSEGDSWFQYPLILDDVIDHLKSDYLIWSLGKPGDTAENTILRDDRDQPSEYLVALRDLPNVRGFLLSAAGNDVLGTDPNTGKSVLLWLLNDYEPEVDHDPRLAVNTAALRQTLDNLKTAYTTVVKNIRAEEKYQSLPILFHGYDYPIPFPFSSDIENEPDPRGHFQQPWEPNKWLGGPFASKGYPIGDLRHRVMKVLVDDLYLMLGEVAAADDAGMVRVVDCRGALPRPGDWFDEIHGTSTGFSRVADRFRDVLSEVLHDG